MSPFPPLLGALLALPLAAQSPDVPFVGTPPVVVQRMLAIAEVKAGDVLYDLGCGDGRIVIAAVQIKGVTGACVDIDPVRIQDARANAEKAGVADRIRFVEGDLFKVPIDEATVVTLYLLPAINQRLRPRLLGELKPGTRVVSHAFDMGDWAPEKHETVDSREIYFWKIPAKAK